MNDEKKTGLIEKKSNALTKGPDKNRKEFPLNADPETLQTTDPQEDMEGPISSIMQTIKKEGKSNDVVSKKEADWKKDENT